MKLITAVEEVLEEDVRTRRNEYLWIFVIKVLNKMGYKAFVQMKRGIPSPESIVKERRTILNERNKYWKDFTPEEGVSYEKKLEKNENSM